MEREANKDLSRIEEELSAAGLTLSPVKTRAMLVTRKRNMTQPNIRLNRRHVEFVTKQKYLGITLDSKLTFNDMIKEQEAKAIKNMNVIMALCGVSWGAHPLIMINIFKAIVRTHLEYGSMIASHKIQGT